MDRNEAGNLIWELCEKDGEWRVNEVAGFVNALYLNNYEIVDRSLPEKYYQENKKYPQDQEITRDVANTPDTPEETWNANNRTIEKKNEKK